MNECFIVHEGSHLRNTRGEPFPHLHTSIYIKKEKKKRRMKASSIYKQLGEYQASACIAKATRWNDLKRFKNGKIISVRNRIWVTGCAAISYHLCFVHRLDVSFTNSAWICCALMFYHWATGTVMIKLHRMNYKIIKIRFAKQSRPQRFDDAHILELWKSDFKREEQL